MQQTLYGVKMARACRGYMCPCWLCTNKGVLHIPMTQWLCTLFLSMCHINWSSWKGRTKNNTLRVWIVGNFHKRFMYQNGWMSRSQLPRTLTDTSLATWWPLIVAFPFSMAISGNWAHSCPPSVPTFKSDAFMFFLPPMPYLQMGIHMVRPA